MHKAPNHLQAVFSVVAIMSLYACDDSDTAAGASSLTADAGEQADAGTKKPQAGAGGAARVAEGGRAATTPERAQDAGAATSDAAPAPERASEEQADQKIKLRFHAQVADEPFACGRDYSGQGSTSQTVTARDLRMFIQDVALVDDEGNEVAVKLDTREPWQTSEVALLDFEDASGECFGNADTNAEITGSVPKGSYRALRFSNGVPDKLNHSDPKSFPPPLKTPGMGWSWLLGLRFLRFEMATQTPDAGDADLDAGNAAASFALHIGSTACAGSQNEGNITCAKPNRSRVELSGFDVDKSEIVLDVSKLLSGSDLSKVVECHSASAECEPMFRALGVSYETGKATPDQSAFRLK